MPRRIYTAKGFFDDTTNYFDETGRMIGYSQKSILGNDEFFDASGHFVGFSADGLLADKEYFDETGRYAGFTAKGLLSDQEHFDAEGRSVGLSSDGLFGETDTFLEDDQDFFGQEDEKDVTFPKPVGRRKWHCEDD